MATQKTEINANNNMPQSSEGRKLYPMTEEIYERGEKVFWETFEKLEKERPPKSQEEDSEGIQKG